MLLGVMLLPVLSSPKALRPDETGNFHRFNPSEIHILLNPDLDIVYHTLAYFSVPGDPSNLYSKDYMDQIRQAKMDLEAAPTKLDASAADLNTIYSQLPRLRFLNLAPFMADDYASFKQALALIDFNFRTEAVDSTETYEQRKARDALAPLFFGNTRRLIPLLRNRFPDPAEHAFVKRFAECMDDERDHFYKIYREARTEVDQAALQRFQQFWASEGLKMISPIAARTGVTVFNLYLCPVMQRNGRGVPVNQDQKVLFNVVIPLPEVKEQTLEAFFVALHETTHRLTDRIVDLASGIPEAEKPSARENASFYADHVYLKSRYPRHHLSYLKFFLHRRNSGAENKEGEAEFLRSYPLDSSVKASIEQLLKEL